MNRICKRCIDALRSRGEIVYVGPIVVDYDEAADENITCDLCDEITELYDCKW